MPPWSGTWGILLCFLAPLAETTASGLHVFGGSVLPDEDARAEPLGSGQLESSRPTVVGEQALTFPQDDWVQHDPVDIDEVFMHERVHELRATGEQKVLPGLLLELANPIDHF